MSESAAIAFLQQSDPVLAHLIERIGPCQLQQAQQEGDVLASLSRAIVSQQLSTKAAAAIYQRFLLLYPDKPFPSAQDLLDTPVETLRSVGLSRPKITYLQDLAQKIQAGLPTLAELQQMDDEAIIQQLTQVKGIGRWSVQMLLIFRMQRPDVLPVDDLGIRSAIQKAYGLSELPTKKVIEQIAQAWKPYRSIACWYLWRSLDLKSES